MADSHIPDEYAAEHLSSEENRGRGLALLTGVFYTLWAFLGFNCGAALYFWKSVKGEHDTALQYLWGGAGVFVVVMAFCFINESSPGKITRLLSRFRNLTSGGWPWQQGRLWWAPFVLFLSVPLLATFVLVSYHLQPHRDVSYEFGFWYTIWRLSRSFFYSYVGVLPLVLLWCYGRAFARKWTEAGTVIAAGLSVAANIAFVLWALLEPRLYSMLLSIGPPAVVFWPVTVFPVFLSFLQVRVGILFYRELKGTETKEAPEPVPSSPWRGRDFLMVLLVIPLICLVALEIVEERVPGSPLYLSFPKITFYLPYIIVILFVPFRRSVLSFLLGQRIEAFDLKRSLKIAGPFFFFLLAVSICRDPKQLMDWFSQQPPSDPFHTVVLSNALFALVGAIGYEFLTRGIFYEFFSRSFGVTRTLVFLPLFSIGLAGVGYNGLMYLPGAVAYSIFRDFGLTLLRYYSGALLMCIAVRCGLVFIAEPALIHCWGYLRGFFY